MDRITGADVAVDLHGAGKDGFADPDPGVTAATVVTGDWLNAVQEEICNAVESADIALSSVDNTQLTAAIETLAIRAMNTRVIGMAIASHTLRTAPASVDYKRVAYGASDGLFVAVSDHASDPHTSPDGVTWTARSATDLRAVCHGNGTFVCVGDGGQIMSSTNGTAYSARTAAGGYVGSFRCCTGSASLFVIGGTGGAIQTSPDGITWTARTPAASFAGGFLGACNGGGLYVLVGEDTSVPEIQTSPNGTTWTQRTPSEASGTLFDVAYGGGIYVAVGIDGGGDNLVMSSPDCVTWTTRTVVGTGGLLSVAYDAIREVFVTTGATGAISMSSDGITWTDLSRAGFSTNLYGVAFGDHSCIMVGSSSALRQSLALVGLDAV